MQDHEKITACAAQLADKAAGAILLDVAIASYFNSIAAVDGMLKCTTIIKEQLLKAVEQVREK